MIILYILLGLLGIRVLSTVIGIILARFMKHNLGFIMPLLVPEFLLTVAIAQIPIVGEYLAIPVYEFSWLLIAGYSKLPMTKILGIKFDDVIVDSTGAG